MAERWSMGCALCGALLWAAVAGAQDAPASPPGTTPDAAPPAQPAPPAAPAVPAPGPKAVAPASAPAAEAPADAAQAETPAPDAKQAAPEGAAPPGSTAAPPGSTAAPPASVPAEPEPAPAQPAPEPGPAQPAPAADVPPPAYEAPPEPVAPPLKPFHIGLGTTFGVLNMPNLAVGLTLHAQFAPQGLWPIELSASYFLENEESLTANELDLWVHPIVPLLFPTSGSRLALDAVQVNVALCPLQHPLTSGQIFVCGGAYGGMLHAKSEGFVHEDGDESRGLFGFEAFVRWRFGIAGPLGFAYSAGLFVPLLRDRFMYVDRFGTQQELFQQAPVGGRVDLLLALGF